MCFEDNVYAFLKELRQFDYKIQSVDHIWDVIFPGSKEKYHHIKVIKYHEVFYINDIDGKLCTLEVTPKKSVQAVEPFGHSDPWEDGRYDLEEAWGGLILDMIKWLKVVQKDWIKANKKVQEAYPINRRYGIVPHALVKASLSDIHMLDKELGKAKTKKFIEIVEGRYFHDRDKTQRKSMTANDFFEYCKIAYIAGQRKDDHVDESLSGRKLYERYADGRCGGLLEIDASSEKEFADWIDGKHPTKVMGDHPWEIKRGGNTTHIDLYVSRPSYYQKENFSVTLNAPSIARLKEAICMFLAIYEAGLPISIANPESIRQRLLAQDNIGIVPCFDSLHRANQHFPEHQHVYDVLYFDDLGRYKRRIKPFVVWEPIHILKPKD